MESLQFALLATACPECIIAWFKQRNNILNVRYRRCGEQALSARFCLSLITDRAISYRGSIRVMKHAEVALSSRYTKTLVE